jgi:CubicO group peptidase (beta-lactamase class C family)
MLKTTGEFDMIGKATEALERVAASHGVVGLSAAAICNGRLIFEGALGLRDKENELPATPNTVYRMASVTKHISAMTLMTLVDEGRAELDADVSDYLGYCVRSPYWPDVPITLRQLMTHTSGLVERGSYNRILSGEMPPYKLSDVLKPGGPGDDLDNWLPDKPGIRYDYSSFGTGVMGAVGEKLSGHKFAELVRRRIFEPLGLRDAALDVGALAGVELAKPDAAGGIVDTEWLRKSLENKQRLCALPVGEAYRAAQGNGYMRARDLLTVTQVLLGGGVSKGVRILSENSVKEMCAVQFDDGFIRSGLNLHHYDHLAPQRLTGHYGRAFGALAVFMFDPQRKAAAAVLCNGAQMEPDGRGVWGNTMFCTQAIQALWAACFPSEI